MDAERYKELVALYALGTLDEAEKQEIERYLPIASAEERQELQQLTEVAALLPLALPHAPVPDQLKARLLERINEESAQPTAAKVLEFTPRATERSFFDFFTWPSLLAAATLLLAITSGLLLWQNSQVSRERDQLAQQVTELSRLQVATQQQLDELVTQTTKFVSLAGQEAPQANAKVFWDTERNEWVVYIFNLPAAPPDKDYQLWYITHDQQKVSAKVFETDALGRTELRLSLPQNVAPRIAATAVTLEPKGGSPQPTSGLYLVGTVGT
jgi:anti-sigma-K factor RskA